MDPTTPIQQDTPFRYSDLPAEIREKILGILLICYDPIVPGSLGIELRGSVNMLLTSRQTYKEAAHILYRKNDFCFLDLADIETWLHPRPNLTTISHAVISLSVDSLEDIDTMQSSEWFRFLTLLKQASPELRTLVIMFWPSSTFFDELDRNTLVRLANQMLKSNIRNLKFLRYSGPRVFDDEGFREVLDGMLANPQRESSQYLMFGYRRSS